MTLYARLMLVLVSVIGLTLLAAGVAWWVGGRNLVNRPGMPLPGQLAAMIEMFDRLPADRRESIRGPFAAEGLHLHFGAGVNGVGAEPAGPPRGLPAVGWMVSRYRVALGERPVRAERVETEQGARLWLKTVLSDGTPLGIEIEGPLLRRLRIRQFFLLLSAALLMTAGLGAWGLRRQVRPIEQLADSMDRFGTPLALSLPPPAGAPEVRRLQQAFVQASGRIESLMTDRDRLFAAVSHDLGTYLTRLRLRMELIGDEVQRSRAERDVERMAELLRDLLDLSRSRSRSPPESAAERKTLDLAALVAEEAEALHGHPGVRHVEVATLPAQPLWVRGHPRLLRRLLANLLDNAAKHGGGHVELSLSARQGRAVLWVEDRGTGLQESELGRALEPFYRGDAARNLDRGGSGLGLAIAADIARQHGGELSLHRRPSPQAGLRVVLHLPLWPGN